MQLSEYPPLTLAYIGDAVFELCVREKVVTASPVSVSALNLSAKNYVKAGAQAVMYHKVLPHLTDEEAGIIKRGRNAKAPNTAKSATVTDYRHATGLEALFGYLYLAGRRERIDEIFNICTEKEGGPPDGPPHDKAEDK